MAENRRYQNISIRPLKFPRSAKQTFELPRENLSQAELERKSTSDNRKRRVAHYAWFPLPVIKKPIVPVKAVAQKRPKKIPKSCKQRQIKKTVAAGSEVIRNSMSSVVRNTKRKTEDLDNEDIPKKRQRKVNVVKSKMIEPTKDVGDSKRKTEDSDNVDIPKKRQRKIDAVESKMIEPTKDVNDTKRKTEDLDSVDIPKKRQRKINVDKSKMVEPTKDTYRTVVNSTYRCVMAAEMEATSITSDQEIKARHQTISIKLVRQNKTCTETKYSIPQA